VLRAGALVGQQADFLGPAQDFEGLTSLNAKALNARVRYR
jgi:hypothetical protein